jgi:hypothetical protein
MARSSPAAAMIPDIGDPRAYGWDCAEGADDGGSPETGAKLLVRAVFEDAFRQRKKLSQRSRRGARCLSEDAAWIRSEDEHPFSFVWCCHVLDIAVSTARRAYFAIPPRD